MTPSAHPALSALVADTGTATRVEFIVVADRLQDVSVYDHGQYARSYSPGDPGFDALRDWFRDAPVTAFDNAFETAPDNDDNAREDYAVRLRPAGPSA